MLFTPLELFIMLIADIMGLLLIVIPSAYPNQYTRFVERITRWHN